LFFVARIQFGSFRSKKVKLFGYPIHTSYRDKSFFSEILFLFLEACCCSVASEGVYFLIKSKSGSRTKCHFVPKKKCFVRKNLGI
jgi:hypothetical protein